MVQEHSIRRNQGFSPKTTAKKRIISMKSVVFMVCLWFIGMLYIIRRGSFREKAFEVREYGEF